MPADGQNMGHISVETAAFPVLEGGNFMSKVCVTELQAVASSCVRKPIVSGTQFDIPHSSWCDQAGRDVVVSAHDAVRRYL
jgi:hypothetical protein